MRRDFQKSFNSTQWINTRVNKDRIHKVPFSNWNHRLVYLRKWQIQKQIDRTNFISLSDNINATLNFRSRLFRSKVVSIETKQICWKIFSLAVNKRTKNNLYMHWVSVFIIYSSIKTFASIELTFDFDWMNFRSKQSSMELTRYHSILTEIWVICRIESVDPVADLGLTNQIYSNLCFWIQRNHWSTKYHIKMLL